MNFETLIKEALAKGMSPETIAAGFTEAMNKVDTANKSKKEKEEYINSLREAVKDAHVRDCYTFDYAANVVALAAAASYPDWDFDKLKSYRLGILESIQETDKLFNDLLKKNFDISLSSVMDQWDKLWKHIFQDDDDSKLKKFLQKFD